MVEGFYYCECGGIPGTRLSADQHTCEVVNLCLENNGGCSHSCLSVNGQAFCSCPSGREFIKIKLEHSLKIPVSSENNVKYL